MVVLEETFVPELESKANDLIRSIEDKEYRGRVDKDARKIAWDAGQRFVFEEDVKDAERVLKAQDRIQAIEDSKYRPFIEARSLEISREKMHRYVFLEDVLEAESELKCGEGYN